MPRIKKQHLKRRKDGRYRCKYKNVEFYGDTEEEALQAREEYKRAEEQKTSTRRHALSVIEYAAEWLPVHKAGVKDSTYNGYVSVLNHTLSPISTMTLQSVTTDDIARTYAALVGFSASYIHKAKILISAMFASAVDAGYIAKNPCRAQSVKPPKGTRGSHRALSTEEISLICTIPHRMRLPALTMLYAGLRRGEAIALTKDDASDGIIRVHRAVYYTGNQPVMDTPKSESGRREVPIMCDALMDALDECKSKYITGTEKPLTETAWSRGWENYLKTLSDAAGHPVSFRAHDLRHTFCTICRDAGVDLHQTQVWMGHADAKLILQVYDHVGETREIESQNRFQNAIRGQIGGQIKKLIRINNAV